jgi:hypothetical protein
MTTEADDSLSDCGPRRDELENGWPPSIQVGSIRCCTTKSFEILQSYTKSVYRFLDERLHPKTVKWIANNARRKRNGTMIATRWQNVLTVSQNEQILAACSELFRLLKAV